MIISVGERKIRMTTARSRFQTAPWIILAASIVCIHLFFVFLTPTGSEVRYHIQGLNDEKSHFNYVKTLALMRVIPVQEHLVRDSGSVERGDYEYYQPPLYYALCAPLYLAFGEWGGLQACRILSVLAALLSVVIIVLILRQMSCSGQVQIAGAMFVGLTPVSAYFFSLVSNDGLSWLFSILLVYELLKAEKRELENRAIGWGATIRMTLYLLAGIATKASVFLFYPVITVVIIRLLLKRRNMRFVWPFIGILLVPLVIMAPWFARSWQLYYSHTTQSFCDGPNGRSMNFGSALSILRFVKSSIRYFWFPMSNTYSSVVFRLLCGFGSVILAAIGGCVALFLARARNRSTMTAFLAGLLALNLAAYVCYNVHWGNQEGRFLYTSLPSIVFFIFAPLEEALTRINRGKFFLPSAVIITLFPYLFLALT